jgi:hypothetical protein
MFNTFSLCNTHWYLHGLPEPQRRPFGMQIFAKAHYEALLVQVLGVEGYFSQTPPTITGRFGC